MTRSLSRPFSANSRSISPSRSSAMSVEPAVPFAASAAAPDVRLTPGCPPTTVNGGIRPAPRLVSRSATTISSIVGSWLGSFRHGGVNSRSPEAPRTACDQSRHGCCHLSDQAERA